MNTSVLRACVAVGLLAYAVVAHTGCLVVAAGAAGAGTVAYVRGDLQATLDADYDRAVRATRGGIEKMGFALISERKDALVAEFVARTAQDKKVQVRVTKQTENNSGIRIRVSVFGDEQISRALLDAIKARL